MMCGQIYEHPAVRSSSPKQSSRDPRTGKLAVQGGAAAYCFLDELPRRFADTISQSFKKSIRCVRFAIVHEQSNLVLAPIAKVTAT
jgi:hypothetical protein